MSSVVSPIARRASRWLRRAAAALALISAGLHAASLGGHATSLTPRLVIAAMIVGCLFCARHLWVRGSHRDWGLVAIMNVGMIAVHAMMMRPESVGTNHHEHPVTAVSVSMDHSMPPLMVTALVTAAVEAVLAVTVLFYQTRISAHETSPWGPNVRFQKSFREF